MGIKVPRFAHRQFSCFCIRDHDFTDEEIQRIIWLGNQFKFERAKVGSSGEEAPKDVRSSDISWITCTRESEWLFNKFIWLISETNYDHFLMAVDGFESFQFTVYGENEHYNWHFDSLLDGSPWERKISMVLALDDDNDYEGGEFEICHNGNFNDTWKRKLKKGELVSFASWMPHRAHPITKGERRTLVLWVMGPREQV